MTQNELYELVADFGEVYGTALRRDSYLTRGIDWPENWLNIDHVIGEHRAELLCNGQVTPTQDEMRGLIRWQVERALDLQDPDVTPTLWFCHNNDDDEIFVIEGWGDSLTVELKFKLIGRFPDETTAIKELKRQYIFSVEDLDEKAGADQIIHS